MLELPTHLPRRPLAAPSPPQGHVWQSKGFPTKRGGKRRSEAKRLLRVLELMKADHAREVEASAAALAKRKLAAKAAAEAAAANGEAPPPAAAAEFDDDDEGEGEAVKSELWVYERVLEEVKKQVGLKCSDQAVLIERIFDGQSEMVMRLPEQLVQKEKKAKALEKALAKSREETRTLVEMMKPLQESKRKLQLEVGAPHPNRRPPPSAPPIRPSIHPSTPALTTTLAPPPPPSPPRRCRPSH